MPIAFSRAAFFTLSSSICPSTSSKLVAALSFAAIWLNRNSGIVAYRLTVFILLEPLCYSGCDLPNGFFAKELPNEQPSTRTGGPHPASLGRRIANWNLFIDLRRVRERWPCRADLFNL